MMSTEAKLPNGFDGVNPECNTAEVASNTRPVGAVSNRIGQNLRRLRRGSTYGLADRLRELGWPIQQSGITRVERGERRVDVDDLVALALALEVNPNQLLMPDMTPLTAAQDVDLIGKIAATAKDAWAWAVGEEKLVVRGSRAVRDESLVAQALFVASSQPHRYAQTGTHSVLAGATGGAQVTLRALIRQYVRAGIDPDILVGIVSKAVAEEQAEFDIEPL